MGLGEWPKGRFGARRPVEMVPCLDMESGRLALIPASEPGKTD